MMIKDAMLIRNTWYMLKTVAKKKEQDVYVPYFLNAMVTLFFFSESHLVKTIKSVLNIITLLYTL